MTDLSEAVDGNLVVAPFQHPAGDLGIRIKSPPNRSPDLSAPLHFRT